MNRLSQEIVDHILSYLFSPYGSHEWSRMLTVSKAFQKSIEKVMLARYELTEDNVQRFLQLYSTERVHYLRHVEFQPTLPMSSPDCDCNDPGEYHFSINCRRWDEGCREKSSELLEKDKSFTRQVNILFRTLKSLEERTGSILAGRLRLTMLQPTRVVNPYPCRHRVCVCWRVHLLHPQTLPQLSSIHTLELKGGNGAFHPMDIKFAGPEKEIKNVPSKLDLRILIDLASKLVSLEQLKCSIETYFPEMNSIEAIKRHYMQDWAGPHRDTRHDFARALETIRLPSLKGINLNFHPGPKDEDRRDQQIRLPNLILPQQYDPFSNSLRILSYQLETMILRLTADQTLLWPTDGTIPSWPNLKYLDVSFCAYSPSGAWYFEGPRGEGSDTSLGYEITQEHYEPMGPNGADYEYDQNWRIMNSKSTTRKGQFRIMPNEKTIRPLLVSFAQATSNMPSLRKATLWCSLEFRPSDIYDCYEDKVAEISEMVGGKGSKDPDSYRLGWGIVYARPGENIDMSQMCHRDCESRHQWARGGDCGSRQLWWLTQGWRPDAALYSLIGNIGESYHGGDAAHRWSSDLGHKWHCWCLFHGLVPRGGIPPPEISVKYPPWWAAYQRVANSD